MPELISSLPRVRPYIAPEAPVMASTTLLLFIVAPVCEPVVSRRLPDSYPATKTSMRVKTNIVMLM